MVGAQWLSVEESGQIPHASLPPQSWILPSGDGPICHTYFCHKLQSCLAGVADLPNDTALYSLLFSSLIRIVQLASQTDLNSHPQYHSALSPTTHTSSSN